VHEETIWPAAPEFPLVRPDPNASPPAGTGGSPRAGESRSGDRGAQTAPPAINLRGERIAIGPLSRDLLADYGRWLNDFAMLALIDRHFRPLTADWIETWYARHARGVPNDMVFTLWELDGWRPIGNAALQDIDPRNRTAELGLFIGEPERRGHGLGTEAVRLLLGFAFGTLGLQSVILRVFAYNETARRAYERVGFREFGRRHRSQLRDGRFWDTIYMECLAEDFVASATPPPSA